MKTKLLALSMVIALLGGGALLLRSRQAQHGHGQPHALLPVVVETQRLAPGHTCLTLPVVTDVQALRDSVVASRITAYITALPLYEGQRFREGEVLARLEVSQVEAEVQRAEATLAETRVKEDTLAAELAATASALKAEQERVQRLQTLHKGQNVSLEQLQSAEANLATLRARQISATGAMQSYQSLRHANQAAAEAARESLSYAVITAPFDGVVGQRLAQAGDLATPGKPLLKVIDSDAGNRLLVSVPEAIRPAGLLLDGELLPLAPWPEATAQGLRRYEAHGGAGLASGSRVEARLVVFRSPQGIRLPADCLLNEEGDTATLLALKVPGEAAADPPAMQSHPGAPQTQAGHASKGHDPSGHAGNDQAAPSDRQAGPGPAGGHRAQPSAGALDVLKVGLAARGEEGAATTDAGLAGRDLVCASPDILARLAAGTPFQPRAAN